MKICLNMEASKIKIPLARFELATYPFPTFRKSWIKTNSKVLRVACPSWIAGSNPALSVSIRDNYDFQCPLRRDCTQRKEQRRLREPADGEYTQSAERREN